MTNVKTGKGSLSCVNGEEVANWKISEEVGTVISKYEQVLDKEFNGG